MKLEFEDKKISGILTVLPEYELKFEDEIENYNFTLRQSMKLKLVMGYDKRRIAPAGTTSLDLLEFGANYLFKNNLVKKEEIDGIIVVTQSPDYFMPSDACLLHGKLGLGEDVFCLDISQGCAGFIIGLIQAFCLLEQKNINKILLMNADVLSSKVSKRDRNSAPLSGDGASIAIVEKGGRQKISAEINFDGKNAMCLNIPAGGFRTPSTPETAVEYEDESGNFRSLNHLTMKGDDVFNFVLNRVPSQIEKLLEENNLKKEEIDYFFCHQPNKFMLQKLADKLGVSYEKLPNNVVENFGNASGVSIPTCISYNLGDKLEKEKYKVLLSGFGVGLTWASIIMELGQMKFNKIAEYRGKNDG